MKKILLIILTISFCGLTACKTGTKKGGDMDKETLVKIETTLGDIEVKLYNETPKHRDNFIKLVKDGVYEGTLFHRVIKDFMVQAGDPDSKNAPKGKMLGTGDVGYTVPAEFVYPKYFHKKGALSVRPKKRCLFPKGDGTPEATGASRGEKRTENGSLAGPYDVHRLSGKWGRCPIFAYFL